MVLRKINSKKNGRSPTNTDLSNFKDLLEIFKSLSKQDRKSLDKKPDINNKKYKKAKKKKLRLDRSSPNLQRNLHKLDLSDSEAILSITSFTNNSNFFQDDSLYLNKLSKTETLRLRSVMDDQSSIKPKIASNMNLKGDTFSDRKERLIAVRRKLRRDRIVKKKIEYCNII